LNSTNDRLLAIEIGCKTCETLQCDGTVGYGGSPDEHGETTLDAMIMDGVTHDVGSVGGLRRIRDAISVARAVMNYTTHTLLVGDMATNFALEMGFKQEETHSPSSMQKWIDWYKNNCQPNYRRNVLPDPSFNCGPYTPIKESTKNNVKRFNTEIGKSNHDTIGMIAIDSNGNIAGGTSTNGASHKVPGRVGDSPIVGSGAYVDNEVGGACGTGDGDVLMRFLPAYQTVESMRNGMNPSDAAADAIKRIAKFYPKFAGALVAIDKYGNHGAACNGMDNFHYSVQDAYKDEPQIVEVNCIQSLR
jgi:N4-(beta-N-acetylglucosaminyl)-L-asparaginase